MLTASIVLYKTNLKDLSLVIDSYIPGKDRFLFLVDNSPEKTNLPIEIKSNQFIKYIFVGKNIGYGAGHNIAIREAFNSNSKYHIVLNPDIIFKNDIVNTIVTYMDHNSNVGQIMPKVVNPQNDVQFLCKLIPTPFDLLFKRFLPSLFKNWLSIKFQLKFTNYNEIMEVPYLSGCFMFFRVSALKEIGLFDERFFMYPEDIDITRRMNEVYKTLYYPDVTIIHAHAADSYKSMKMFLIHFKNMFKYFNKWGWFLDKKRRSTNKRILEQLNYKERVTI